MTIDLKPEQQRVIDLPVQSGAYRNSGEVLEQAFAIIREQLDFEDWMLEEREAVAAHIEMGFAEAGRGELIDGDAALEMLRQRGRAAEPAGMNTPFEFTAQATEDLDAIWWFIAEDNRDAANRVEAEVVASCRRLARYPLMGSKR